VSVTSKADERTADRRYCVRKKARTADSHIATNISRSAYSSAQGLEGGYGKSRAWVRLKVSRQNAGSVL
jgi:hypothetical protein